MEVKNVKQSMIFGIALLVAFLMSLPRVLERFEIIDNLSDSFAQATLQDIVVRAVFIFSYSWILLQFNTNWKFYYSNLHFFLSSAITVAINAIVFFVTVYFLIIVHDKITGDIMMPSDIMLLYFVYCLVLLMLVFISRNLRYHKLREADTAEKELLKQQSLRNELEALKNQINPHFLFNSLNSLNSLIRDNKQATTFVNKLSFMYRYILQSGSEDLVTLKEELKFLESYVYLIKTRYRDRFEIEIEIDDGFLSKKLPALALQLLVENAVKHSEISGTNPLLVKVYSKDNFIIVENAIKLRTTFVDSTGNGLVNLDKRYKILMKKNISISDANKVFKVKLPLK